MCDHVLIGLSFVPALVVCTLPVVACVGIEPGRACAHLLVDHLAKVVPTQGAPGQHSGFVHAPDFLVERYALLHVRVTKKRS